MKKILKKKVIAKKLNLLSNPKVIRWCYEPVTPSSLVYKCDKKKLEQSKVAETMWGNKVIKEKNSKQWTTKLCQELVLEALIKQGKNARKAIQMKSSVKTKRYEPDLECDEFVYEVKGRSWCTVGTAGEKILGVPLKYGELPRLYDKTLRIVLVGYQEYEAREKFGFGDLLGFKKQTKELKDTLAYFKKHNIEYVPFTDILKNIGLKGRLSVNQISKPVDNC